MKKILLSLALFTIAHSGFSQVVVWQENFEDAFWEVEDTVFVKDITKIRKL
ncbi:MAG: hypothetical protein KAS71_18385 [Bacteroidales bacterium]|nr:hypothetical protein [Bacteroidales bacterium]